MQHSVPVSKKAKLKHFNWDLLTFYHNLGVLQKLLYDATSCLITYQNKMFQKFAPDCVIQDDVGWNSRVGTEGFDA